MSDPAARPVRWCVLAAFALLTACTQLLWLTYAPITPEAARAYGVDEGAVGDLAALQPLLYVLLALPTGRWLDRRFAAALAVGAVVTATGAVIRAVDPLSYPLALVGQLVLSVGQPLVLNGTTKVAARYFPPGERTAAISVGSAAQFVGVLLAATTGAPLFEAGGLARLLTVQAVVTVAAALTVLVAVRVPAAHPAEAAERTDLGRLPRDPVQWRLAALLFIGVGGFNALATWLDSILTAFGRPGSAGTLIAVTTVAGILGAVLLPAAAARLDRRRELLAVAAALTAVGFASIALVHDTLGVGLLLAVVGFVLLACLPVALDWSELRAGPARAGTATGFLLLAGNLGGVVLVLVVQLAIGNPYAALLVMAALAVPGVVVALGLPRHARAHGAPPDGGTGTRLTPAG